LLSRCTRLEELGLKVLNELGVPLVGHLRMPFGPSTMTTFPQSTFETVAPLSGTLQSLNVVVVPSVPLHHLQKVEAFLLQAMTPLRKINMWLPATVPTYGSRCISWEVRLPFYILNIGCSSHLQRRWVYDEDLGLPRRYIEVIPRPDHQWRNKA
jgi:hypothetical protein